MKIRTLSAVTSVKFFESLWDVYINLYTYIYMCVWIQKFVLYKCFYITPQHILYSRKFMFQKI